MKILRSLILVSLLTTGCTGSRRDDPNQPSTLVQIKRNVTNQNFGGFGFHVFYHIHNAPRWHYEQVFAKRWRELNPSFARITDYPDWDNTDLDRIAPYLEVMKETDTKLYFTTWGTNAINNYDREIDYVKKEVDNLEYLKRNKGFSNIQYYCMTNELSLDKWASLVNDLDKFKRIQHLFYDEINHRNLEIGLLATDASPIRNWHTIEWASQNMDDITGVYGGHHYINSYNLMDLSFYPFFLEKMKWGAGIARSKNKNFIIGEFGPKQNSNIIDSVKHDACIYNNTPLEPYVGIQIGEALIAMINGGIYASSYWTFSDFPSSYRKTYINKWGVFKWEIDNYTTRPSYYALGLFTKFFRGPARVYETASADSLLRISAIRNVDDNSISIAIINRNQSNQMVNIQIEDLNNDPAFRKYIYDPENPPFNYFGDLQEYSKKINPGNQNLLDTIPAHSLVVYTTKFDETPPSPVIGLTVDGEQIKNQNVLKWEPNEDDDFCYYRIYRSEEANFKISARTQIASTISDKFIDKTVHGLPQFYYKIVAVDNSGNASEIVEK